MPHGIPVTRHRPTTTDRPTSRRKSVRTWLVLAWCTSTLLIAAYAVLKPRTTAADLVFLPTPLVGWLDLNYNFRTLVMTIGVASVPVVLMRRREDDRIRRWVLMLVLALLMAFETSQIWIPTRGFSWQDVAYTLGGGVLCEAAALLWQVGKSPVQTAEIGDVERIETRRRRGLTIGSSKLFVALLCAVLIVLQLAYLLLTPVAVPVV